MSGAIYLVGDAGLSELVETPYEAESTIQSLLADYPKLLAGEQMDSSEPRRWLLIRREIGVPDREGGGGRWSLDHLFVDQDGVPTLVEVKRSSDSRARRQVVGQMLDYAANGVAYWPLESIIEHFVATCEAMEIDPEELLREFSGETDPSDFWQDVKTNLQAGRIRMVFVADAISQELRRIVEFLNEQLDPAEVYAVEVRRYAAGDHSALVPRLIGNTAEATDRRNAGSGRRWTEASFLDAIEEESGDVGIFVAQHVLDWGKRQGLRMQWGKGAGAGSVSPKLDVGGTTHHTFSLYTNGWVQLPFEALKPPFESSPRKEALVARLNDALGKELISPDQIDRYPRFSVQALGDQAILARFLGVFDAYAEQVRKAEAAPA